MHDFCKGCCNQLNPRDKKMTEPRFGCPACGEEEVMVRSETEGYAYDQVLSWDEDGEPQEQKPFQEEPVMSPSSEEGGASAEDEEYFRLTRFWCWTCGNAFPEPAALD